MEAFACPPDCGQCCSRLERPAPREERRAHAAFRALVAEHGIYHCGDGHARGLSLSNEEAAALRGRAAQRGMRLRLHPRTFLLETRRRVAVVLDWHMPYASCPFLDGFRCTVYDERPLVCRAYPVMLASPLRLAPECPKAPVPASAVRAESRARRAIERAHAKLDEVGWLLLDAPGARFAKGLPPREAAARLRRYRHESAEEFASRRRARPSTS